MASPEEMIQNILSDPDAMSKIGDMLGALSGGAGSEPEPAKSSSALPFDNPEQLIKLSSMLQKLSGEEDNNTRLITALKPYLSKKRLESADKAIKFMKLSKITSMLGDVNLF